LILVHPSHLEILVRTVIGPMPNRRGKRHVFIAE
jgi:hypothetical protein